MAVCPKCGLPKELCICETIAKESQKIHIEMVQKRYRKSMTIIRGIDTSKIDVRELMKKLKSKLACGGTVKENEIVLQGKHMQKVKEILMANGYKGELIDA